MKTTKRIGVFCNGNQFIYVKEEIEKRHAPLSSLCLIGMHDALEHLLHGVITESHCVTGRIFDNSPLGGTLARAGMQLHPLATGSKDTGADVALSLLAYARTLEADLDTVVLIAANAAHVPLAQTLTEHGADVIALTTDYPHPHHDDFPLAYHADIVPWEKLVTVAAETPTALPLFQQNPKASPSTPDSPHRRTGTINHWDHSYGFLTDHTGRPWYVHISKVKDHVTLQKGDKVTFSGSPYPEPGKKYPTAYTVRLEHQEASTAL